MSKVKRIIVSNLKAISAMSADLDGCTAIITGGNRKGKSSFLRSLPDRIRGIKPDIVVKHGEKEGEATWELTSGEKFIWKFTDDKERLVYISDKDIKSSVTKDISARYFPPVFDVDKFLLDGPSKQRTALQKLVGLDFTEIDGRYKAAYEERTWANRKAGDDLARLKPVDLELPVEELPTETLEKDLAGIDLHNQKVKQIVDGVALRNKTIEDNNTTIASLETQIAELRAKNDTLQLSINDGLHWLDSPKNAPITDDRKTELKMQITAVKDQNKSIADNNEARKQAVMYTQAQESATKADELVKAIQSEKDTMIKSANLPEGFGFTDDGITFNNLPFNRQQLASSELYIAALKLAAMTLGEVRTLHFDASFLDNQSLAEIEKWAQSQDLQLLIEMPDREGGDITYELINTSE